MKVGLIAYLADRPEKASALKTSLLGTYGKRSNWAAEIDHIHLPDCQKCFKHSVSMLLRDRFSIVDLPRCQQCCNWNMESQSNSNGRTPCPARYPQECHPDSPAIPMNRPMGASTIPPVKQSFLWLCQAVTLAEHNVRASFWKKGVLTAYLRSCSIASSVIQRIWTKYNPKKGTHNAISQAEDDDDSEIDDGSTADTMIDSCVPRMWEANIVMDSYLDCGMHLIFHGVVSDIVELARSFMSDHGLESKFNRLVNPFLLDVQSLRLPWCHMKYFPKKQWLAEDELGLSRIMPFIYGQFFLNLNLPAASNTTKATLTALKQLFHSLHVMVALLMRPNDGSYWNARQIGRASCRRTCCM